MAKLELRLRTWIPQDKILYESKGGGRITYFKGDARRSAMWSTLAYRTSNAFTIDTSKANYGLEETTRKVSGSTALHYLWGNLVDTETTPDTQQGLSFTYRVREDDNLYIIAKCDAANKLVPLAPAINYHFEIKITRTGSVRIKGQHDGFPAYEFWRSIEGKASGPQLVYFHNPLVTKDGILSLAPPMEYSVDKGLSYTD